MFWTCEIDWMLCKKDKFEWIMKNRWDKMKIKEEIIWENDEKIFNGEEEK